jgi:hypothetical protein
LRRVHDELEDMKCYAGLDSRAENKMRARELIFRIHEFFKAEIGAMPHRGAAKILAVLFGFGADRFVHQNIILQRLIGLGVRKEDSAAEKEALVNMVHYARKFCGENPIENQWGGFYRLTPAGRTFVARFAIVSNEATYSGRQSGYPE